MLERRSPGRIVGHLVVCLLLALPLATGAIEFDSLYTVQVPIDPRDPGAQEKAFASAVNEVLIRVTGSTAAAESPALLDMFTDPVRFVRRFKRGPDNSLVVTLDGTAIETMLRRAGTTIWGSERPLTVVWLAVDWGQGEREIVASDDPGRAPAASRSIDRNRLLRERVQRIAAIRGLPIAFPLLDAEDLVNIEFSDIWGGFDDRLLLASDRYAAESVLVGRIRPDTLQAHRWTWYFGNARQNWTGEPEDVVNRLADSLAAQFAFSGNAPLETISLTISGVASLNAYGELERYMASLSVVDGYEIDYVTGDRVRYRVQVRGGADRLSGALELSSMLEPEDPFGSLTGGFDREPSADTGALEFRYRREYGDEYLPEDLSDDAEEEDLFDRPDDVTGDRVLRQPISEPG